MNAPPAPVHQRPAVRGARRGPGGRRGPAAHHPHRRRAVAHQPARRVPVPPALPQGPGAVRAGGSAAGGQGGRSGHARDLLSLPRPGRRSPGPRRAHRRKAAAMSISELEFQAKSVEDTPAQAIEGRSQWWLTWRRLRRDKMAVAAMIVIVGVIALCAILAPVFASITGQRGNPTVFPQHRRDRRRPARGSEPPSHSGSAPTTSATTCSSASCTGRGCWLFVGVVTTLIGTGSGVTVGLITGYFGGWVDQASWPGSSTGAGLPLHHPGPVAGGGVRAQPDHRHRGHLVLLLGEASPGWSAARRCR